jgi:hypothetical protein
MLKVIRRKATKTSKIGTFRALATAVSQETTLLLNLPEMVVKPFKAKRSCNHWPGKRGSKVLQSNPLLDPDVRRESLIALQDHQNLIVQQKRSRI